MAGRIGVMFQNFGWGSTGGDPVIELRRCFGNPACSVVAQFDTANPRVMP